MSRPLRVQYPNAWYHVMHRGAGRKKIFFHDTHRHIFLEILDDCHLMFNVEIHAYCLMDNHYHLLLRTPDANISRIMRHLNGVYTQRINNIRKTDGALFRGRYKAQLIEEDCYLMVVSRYIHLNPVEAGIVNNPAEYKWSSYSAYVNISKTPRWLTTNIILKYLSTSPSLRHINNYSDYVERHDIEEINVFLSTKLTAPIIGSDEFKERILSKIDLFHSRECAPDIRRIENKPSINTIIEYICKFYGIDIATLRNTKRGCLNWPRLMFMYISRRYFGQPLSSISDTLGCPYRSTVGSGILKCERRLRDEPEYYSEVNKILSLIKDSHRCQTGELQ